MCLPPNFSFNCINLYHLREIDPERAAGLLIEIMSAVADLVELLVD